MNSPAGHAGEALHGMGVSAAGVAFVSWMDERDGGMGVWLARVEGGKAAANVCISALACPCCAPGVIADAKGRVRVIYREMSDDGSREVMVATSTDDGKTFGAGERVNRKDTRIPDCPVDAPAIAQSADGKQWMMAWMAASETDNDRNVYGLLGADGQKGKEERMNKDVKGKQGHPTVAYDAAGTAWAAWEDGRDGTTRVRVGNSTTAQPDDAVSPEGKTATFPSIAAGKRVGVAWEQDGAVEFRLVK